MNTGGETAGILMGFAADLSKEGIRDFGKLGGEVLKYIFLSLLGKLNRQLNTGEVNIKRLIKSGDELVTLDLNDKDAAIFASKAKSTGLTYAIFDVSPTDNKVTYVYKKGEAEMVNKILEKMANDKVNGMEKEVDSKILDEFIINKEGSVYLVDKESPEDYIQVNREEKEILKTYIVDKDNTANYIKMTENMKEKTLYVEIIIDGKSDILNSKDYRNEDIQKRVNEVGKTFSNPEFVYNDIDLEKLKIKQKNRVEEKDKDKNKLENKNQVKTDRKTMKEVDDNIKEVRAKQTKAKTKDKIKDKAKERGDR
ncbi:hypothetical protein J2Z76_002583 [Sedimentibacter acidaminivorans]|uniref:DUF4316 domain-containing protein n=1 Tax=Sedimentibacter acidaminivorans TaxID=913099 RepID=A0ABS4GG95_9FIRM|nr:DUF3801 domain-containing protein [Sedimentibacter acidaminivorans]MBP1926713.1 hypothetical protein [Sedimentibacter acidaminivorans]